MFFPDSKLVTSTVEARYFVRNIERATPRLIVIHSAETAETRASAENTANWFKEYPYAGKKASAHYCLDADSTIQCVPELNIAYHARGGDANLCGIGIEFAGYARQNREEWLDEFGVAMLERGRALFIDIAERYDIPLQLVTEHELRMHTARGIATHAMITRAWGVPGGHMDPGAQFPMDRLLAPL
jgi:N-acetyl-anhydromuramyl-L-alanine amidase AmpD